MASLQRKRGYWIDLFPTIVTEDRRGVVTRAPDMDNPIPTRAVILPERSSKAEVPGQQVINVVRVIIDYKFSENIDIHSRLRWDGKEWDIITPPEHHRGTSHTRHVTIMARQRGIL